MPLITCSFVFLGNVLGSALEDSLRLAYLKQQAEKRMREDAEQQAAASVMAPGL